MEQATKQALQIFATKARMGVLDGVYHAKAGHPGGSLSICDVLSYLYNVRMHVEPKDPKMPDRDRLVLSKGHAAPALYAALALKGFFPVDALPPLSLERVLPEQIRWMRHLYHHPEEEVYLD